MFYPASFHRQLDLAAAVVVESVSAAAAALASFAVSGMTTHLSIILSYNRGFRPVHLHLPQASLLQLAFAYLF